MGHSSSEFPGGARDDAGAQGRSQSPPDAAIRDIDRICRQFGMDALRPQINACAEMLDGDGIVDVAVVGRFKAGKSSFLNSVIGSDLMPVAVLPVTAIVTRVRHGPRDRAIVRRQDGACQEIPLDHLAEFVTEQRNPGNVKAVAIVDVEVSRLRPYRGVRFVDTPGLGSVYAHNTRTSMEWLPRVGAALLAVSIDQPLSEYDIDLLKDLDRHTPEVSILLTKADLVSPRDLADVTGFIQEQIAKVTGTPVRIFPFSIRPGFEAMRQPVQDYLLQHVSARHEETSHQIIQHKLRSLLAGCRQYLGMALAAADAAEEARTHLQCQLQEERQVLSTVRNEIWLLSNELKVRLREGCQEAFLAHAAEVRGGLAAGLRAKMAEWDGNLQQITEDFERWAHDALRSQLEAFSPEVGGRLTRRQLAAAQGSFSRIVRAFQDRLARSIQAALHVSFSGATFEAVINEPKRPDVKIGRVFDTPLEVIWFLIPMWLFGSLVRRHYLRRLPWEVDKNLHRLAGQWSEAIGRSVDDLARQAQGFIEEELTTVEGLVATAEDQRPAVAQGLARLDSLESHLAAVAARIERE
ncbi:MAG: dynamin family protein [candidate division NC10 bacterium]|nr:dynamin family protein [candidate division NC10 bacterium]